MEFINATKIVFLGVLVLNALVYSLADYNWIIKETNYTRLCSTKKILTVNGLFPGPTLYARKGDRLTVNVQNKAKYNVTIHWHGVKQPRNPWSDGPEYVAQCPIKPGANFSYDIIFSDEEGTLWWHAHSDWSRATVHGPIIVYPKIGSSYPFTKPHAEFPIVLGSWYKGDVMEIMETALASGSEFNTSDAHTINGQPGDLYNCSTQGTYKMLVNHGKTYLLRIINSIMNEEMFVKLANHTLTVVGVDGSYIKPIKTSYLFIIPGQTMDVLVTANKTPSEYYLASRAYEGVVYDKTTTTAIFKYYGNYTAPTTPSFPTLPDYTDINKVSNFSDKIKSLANESHPSDVPKTIDTRLIITISMNTLPCVNSSCDGPNGNRLATSMNNVSFETPEIDVLQAYYYNKSGVYTTDFPSEPPVWFNFTDSTITEFLTPIKGTKAKVLKYNSSVEIVFQGVSMLGGAENHPMHLHGYSFYVVKYGSGNYDNATDYTSEYNLVNPPLVNTVGVPKGGWAAIRFRADNPGVWFMHCHLERHASWGMDTVLIVQDGPTPQTSLLKAPQYLNPC